MIQNFVRGGARSYPSLSFSPLPFPILGLLFLSFPGGSETHRLPVLYTSPVNPSPSANMFCRRQAGVACLAVSYLYVEKRVTFHLRTATTIKSFFSFAAYINRRSTTSTSIQPTKFQQRTANTYSCRSPYN